MRKILICSHGKLASGIKNSAELILGKCENLFAINAYLDDEKDYIFKEELEKFYNQCCKEDEIIILTDISKGSVNSEVYKYIKDDRVKIISGINLPFLILLLMSIEKKLTNEILEKMVDESRNELVLLNTKISNESNLENDDLFD